MNNGLTRMGKLHSMRKQRSSGTNTQVRQLKVGIIGKKVDSEWILCTLVIPVDAAMKEISRLGRCAVFGIGSL